MLKHIVRFCFAERSYNRPARARVLFEWITLWALLRLLMQVVKRTFTAKSPYRASLPSVHSRKLGQSGWRYWLNPFRWVGWLFSFLLEWLVSRRYGAYGPALPGVLVVVAVASPLLMQWLNKDRWRGQYYQQLLGSEDAAADTALVEIAVGRLLERSPKRIDLRIQKALLHEKRGQLDAAKREMETVVVQSGNPVAAFWLLKKDFPISEVATWDKNQHLRFRQLCSICALKDNDKVFVPSQVLLAEYLVAIGVKEEAISLLESVARDNCELQLVCAALHSQLGNDAESSKWATQAEEGLRRLVSAEPKNIEVRLNLAKALLLIGQHEAVVLTLNEGYKLTKNENLLTAGAEAFAAWTIRIEKQEPLSPESLVQCLSMLARATELAPRNAIVVETLVRTVIQCAENDDPEIVRLRDKLVSKVEPERAHFIKGTIAVLRGEMTEAEGHLKLAMSDSANIPGVLNNLAVVLYQQENPDLDRALALVNAALKSVPNQPVIRETRGQILLRLKHYKEAIFDLEFALAAKAPPQPIHEALSEAYEALGMLDLAGTHRELAKKSTEHR